MNPIPQFPTLPPPGAVDLALLLGLLALAVVLGGAVILGLSMLGSREARRERTRLVCPVRLRPARVVFGLDRLGRRVDVIRCSVFGPRPITCGKVCALKRA